ncbi:hypothetical protein JCM19233_2001 [Vibrio astriarenae]|nr:hypothetical protein JCM19233_2001 [Vibrio sp. C7]
MPKIAMTKVIAPIATNKKHGLSPILVSPRAILITSFVTRVPWKRG